LSYFRSPIPFRSIPFLIPVTFIITCLAEREYIFDIPPAILVTGFQAFQLVRTIQAILHWLAANCD